MITNFWRELGLSRRDIFRAGGLMAASGMIPSEGAATPPQSTVGQLHMALIFTIPSACARSSMREAPSQWFQGLKHCRK
jgi:hypothetical protein